LATRSLGGSGGDAKNFMVPTISVASKAVLASALPKKKMTSTSNVGHGEATYEYRRGRGSFL
jgi:hypothetical protein